MSDQLKSYAVLVTRPAHQSDQLCSLIEQQGWDAIRFPTLDIAAIKSEKITQQLITLKQWDWLIFISSNAVNFALKANNGKIDNFKHCSIAAVGKATAKTLLSVGLSVDLVPENDFNTEGLLATKEMNQIKGKSCLIIRGQGGREALADSLRERDAKVDYMEVYSRAKPDTDSSIVTAKLQQGCLHAITITSGDALKNLMAIISIELHDKLLAVPLIVISNRIMGLAEKIGFKMIVVTDSPGDTAIIKSAEMMRVQTQQLTNEEYSG